MDDSDDKAEITRLNYIPNILSTNSFTQSWSGSNNPTYYFLHVYNKDVNVVVVDGDAFDDGDDIYHGDDDDDAIVADGDGDVWRQGSVGSISAGQGGSETEWVASSIP